MAHSIRNYAMTLVMLFAAASVPVAAVAQFGDRGTSTLGNSRPQPLPIDQAFPFFVSIDKNNQVTVNWEIAPQHYLYRHRFGFSLKSAASQEFTPLAFTLPDGLPRHDQFFGDIEAYYETVTAHLDLPSNETNDKVLIIEFQGCADWGFCYPPQTTEFPFLP